MVFFIGDFGIEFHIDRTDELPEYSYKWIQNNKNKFRQDIIDIFTLEIETEYKGNKTILRFLDKSGKQKRQFTFSRGFGLPFLHKSEFRRYKPILI